MDNQPTYQPPDYIDDNIPTHVQQDYSNNNLNDVDSNNNFNQNYNPNQNYNYNPNQDMNQNGNTEFLQNTGFEDYAQDPVAGMAVKYGAQVVGDKFGDFNSKFNLYLSFLKYYFDVDTKYVSKKLRIVLLPFTNVSWKRIRVQDEQTGEINFASPRDDINAPDLYIPLMGFVTLVLLVGFSMGFLSNKFHPEVLGTTATSAIICVFLESILLKFGLYLISMDYVPPFLDILSYSSYIFISVIVNLLVGMLFNSLIYHICTIVTSLMIGIFLVRSMRDFILRSSGGVGDKRKQILLFIIIITQILISWFLGSLADWSTNHPEMILNPERIVTELYEEVVDIVQ